MVTLRRSAVPEASNSQDDSLWRDLIHEARLDQLGPQRRPLRTLLAEDNAMNHQKVAVRWLERTGYRPDAVANGLEVLAALQRQTYDVVLLDGTVADASRPAGYRLFTLTGRLQGSW